MASILIIDDQDIVRHGIIKMIKKMDIQISTIFEAGDGYEAISLVKEKHPDIILVDIMMPRLNGLQFIESLKNENIKAHIIIISAYNDFNFAKKAIDFKVDGYILKPVSQKELFQSIVSVLDIIDMETGEMIRTQKRELQYYNILLYEYLSSRDVLIDVEKLFDSIGISKMPFKYFQIILFDFTGMEPEKFKLLERILEDELFPDAHTRICFDNGSRFICLVNMDKNLHSEIVNKLQLLSPKTGMEYFCGLSEICEGTAGLQDIYRQAEISLKGCIYKGDRVCLYSSIKHSVGITVKIKDCENILQHLREGKVTMLAEAVDVLFTMITKENLDIDNTKSVLFSVVNYLHISLVDAYPDIAPVACINEKLQQAASILKMKAVFKEAIEGMLLCVQKRENSDNSSHIINNVMNYIHSNFHKDISLSLCYHILP